MDHRLRSVLVGKGLAVPRKEVPVLSRVPLVYLYSKTAMVMEPVEMAAER